MILCADLVKVFRAKSRNYQYFYNIMPLENMPSVIENGILCFDKASKIPHNSIAMNDVQARRERVRIPNGDRLHSYANLYFTYHNPMMYKRKNEAENLCVLVVHPEVLHFDGCVLSDRNAAADLARFFTPDVGLDEIDFDLVFLENWNDPNPYIRLSKKAIKCAEILIPAQVPYDYILGAYVLDETAKQMLIEYGFDKKIIVKPNVFFR